MVSRNEEKKRGVGPLIMKRRDWGRHKKEVEGESVTMWVRELGSVTMTRRKGVGVVIKGETVIMRVRG